MTSTRHAIDLRNTHFTQRHGDLDAHGTWNLIDEEEEPCLVLIRARDHGRNPERVTPCMIPAADMWMYDDVIGDPKVAATNCVVMAGLLGLPEHPLSVMRVRSIIQGHIGDVLAMPPRPDINRRVMADMIVKNPDTGQVQHVEITDDV